MGFNWQSPRRGFRKSTAVGDISTAWTVRPTWRRVTAPKGRTVAVFGAGLAGLTAAHELAERGFAVTVYERLGTAGGQCRSVYSDQALPGEHGFRSFVDRHRGLADTLRRIPFRGNRNGVHDNLVRLEAAMIAGVGRGNPAVPLPVPVPSGQIPMTPRHFADSFASVFGTLFRLPPHEALFAAERLAVYVSSCEERRLGQWERMSWTDFAGLDNASAEYRRFLGDGFLRAPASTISRDCSAHAMGLVGEEYLWSLSNLADGGAIRVLDGPTSETFIDPWVTHLRSLGVTFAFGARLSGFETDGAHLRGATLIDHTGAGHRVEADYYLCAIPPDKAAAVFSDELLAIDPRLANVSRLRSAAMVGIQFFLRRRTDLARGPVTYLDSPWGLTSISQAQFWRIPVGRYGDGGAADVLSAIIADWTAPGMVNRKSAAQCSPAEIAAETWAQLTAHLDGIGGEPLTDDLLHSWMIDPALRDPGTPDVAHDGTGFVPTPGSWADRPDATTAVDNLFLAGDWIRTQRNVACMDGANEGGRRAANAVLHADGSAASRVPITPRFRMPLWEPLELADSALYHAGRPHAFDLIDRRYPVR
ncbi:hypothetical protein ATM97_12420 [Nocardia sp. MH4]|nr:hypothetical protein [Nocardia sp. MH4]